MTCLKMTFLESFRFRKFQSHCCVLCTLYTLTVSGGQYLLLQADTEAQAKQPHKQCLQTTLALYINDIKMSKT